MRFFLIKQWGYGFWSDVHDVCCKLLISEITNRVPIVFWGKDSLYSVGENYNSFEQYYLPVSDCKISDIISDKLTYYPPIWNFTNVFKTDPDRFSWKYREVQSLLNSNADVLVGDMNTWVNDWAPFLNKNHPAYGLDENNIYRYINKKYIKLQPDIEEEIEKFYHAYMENKLLLGVHVRGGAKLNEDPNWVKVKERYPHEIDSFLKNHPSAKVFLLTDDEIILEEYKMMYGDVLIYTDCTRKTKDDFELCTREFTDKRRKGIEVIKDTYLACKCDYFIGVRESGVSMAVNRLKDWEEDKIKLLW